jgi:acyl carrier protein
MNDPQRPLQLRMSQNTSDVRKWLIKWFNQQTVIDEQTLQSRTNKDYLQEGWIDSMKFIGLVSSVEDEFDIEFSNDEFQDRSFATIDGLAELIAEKSSTES